MRDDSERRAERQQERRDASRPFLDGDEPRVVIEAVASARPGTLVQGFLSMFGSITRYVAVTDTEVWLLRRSRGRVTGVVGRVARQAFGPRDGWIRYTRIGRENVWIEGEEPEVTAADALPMAHGPGGMFEQWDRRGALAHWVYAVLGALVAWLGIGEASAQSVVPFSDSRWFGGVVLVLLSVLMLAAAFVLGWLPLGERGRPLLVPAGWVAIAVGAYLLWNSMAYARSVTMCVVWSGWIAAAAVALRALPRPPVTPGGAEHGRGLVSALATAGVTLSFVWGVVQATALQALSSTVMGSTLTVSATLARAPGADGGGLHGYLLTIDVANPTSVRVPVVASLFRIIAVGTADVAGSARVAESPSYLAVPETHAEVVRYEPVTPERWYLEPDETFHRQVVVLVPPDRPGLHHRVLRATVDLLVARAARFDAVPKTPYRAEDSLLQEFALTPPGRVHRVARGTQKLAVTLDPRAGLPSLPHTGGDAEPYPVEEHVISACVADSSVPADRLCHAPRADKWGRFYGLVTTQTTTEIPFDARPTR